jgi:hypothetical protein
VRRCESSSKRRRSQNRCASTISRTSVSTGWQPASSKQPAASSTLRRFSWHFPTPGTARTTATLAPGGGTGSSRQPIDSCAEGVPQVLDMPGDRAFHSHGGFRDGWRVAHEPRRGPLRDAPRGGKDSGDTADCPGVADGTTDVVRVCGRVSSRTGSAIVFGRSTATKASLISFGALVSTSRCRITT